MFNWFNFGKIKYNNEVYTYDIWVNQEGEALPRRAIGDHHFLTAEELQNYLKQDTEKIIFGTGDPGVAKPSKDAEQLAKKRKIKLIAEPTPKAIQTYNKLKQKNKKVIAIMHITC